ncbi:uncharacterized protein LOC123310360 [Coccinella septempunctata]|uniref:uncharacterized protein LOC123310360 n=1 Tax=Coccinella septempunctata TaxID=41139 RepID=UPI001D083AA4|nr:uncharacterized protein LOC123310360 [Coccinella septempunctata]
MYHPDFSAYGRPAMFFDRRGNLVQPPVWHTPQFLPPPIIQPSQHFYQNIPDQAASLHHNDVPPTSHYEVNGTTYYGSANIHMLASANKQHRRPLPEESDNTKDKKRMRRHHDNQRRHSSFYEKQSDVGSSRCLQQQGPNKKKSKKPFPNIYKPIRSARDETPSQDCSGSIKIKSENRIGAVAKERNNSHKAEDAVSPEQFTVNLSNRTLILFILYYSDKENKKNQKYSKSMITSTK